MHVLVVTQIELEIYPYISKDEWNKKKIFHCQKMNLSLMKMEDERGQKKGKNKKTESIWALNFQIKDVPQYSRYGEGDVDDQRHPPDALRVQSLLEVLQHDESQRQPRQGARQMRHVSNRR